MNYRQYRSMDLVFFTIIGIAAILISEGAFLLMPETQFRLSLVMLVGFLVVIRWGIIGSVSYLLALLVSLFFSERYIDWYVWVPFYLTSAIGFSLPIIVARYKKMKFNKNVFEIIGLFIISFVLQGALASLLVTIIEGVDLIGFFMDYIAANLLNIVIILLFMVLLFKSGNDLFRDIDVYLQEVQEEQEDEDRESYNINTD